MTATRKAPAPRKPAARKPAAAKAPQDHLPKVVKPKVETIEGGRRVTWDGLTVDIMQRRLENWAFAKALRDADRGDELALIDAVELLFGDVEFARIAEHYRDDDVVPTRQVAEYFRTVLGAANPNS